MVRKSLFLGLLLVCPFNAFGDLEKLIDELLTDELRGTIGGTFPSSWAYSGEGGVIRYAEMDLVGDGRNEIIYSRSSRGSLHGSGAWTQDVYFQPAGEERYVKLAGEISMGNFHKKENGKSLFLKASEGNNFDVAGEAAFTRKLMIQEVTSGGVRNQVVIVGEDSEAEIKAMWKATLLADKETSTGFMEGLGFLRERTKLQVDRVEGLSFRWRVEGP